MEYTLVLWPRVQSLMYYDWFKKECYLCQAFEGQKYYDSAYFVPTKRLKELNFKMN